MDTHRRPLRTVPRLAKPYQRYARQIVSFVLRRYRLLPRRAPASPGGRGTPGDGLGGGLSGDRSRAREILPQLVEAAGHAAGGALSDVSDIASDGHRRRLGTA